MKSKQRYTLIFIVIVVTIDTAGFGIIFPVLPQLLTDLLHADISTAAQYGGWLSFGYAFMQFVFAPVLGNLSDAYGRRPVLLSSLLGFGIDCAFLAFAPSILWLFCGRMIAGMTGASFSVASACIADISTGQDRTKYFGLINAAFGAGFILGPAVGGVLAGWGTHAPFLFAALLSFINFIFGYFFFAESLENHNRRKFDWRKANPLGALVHLRKLPAVWSLVIAMLFVSMATHSMESVWSFFTIEKFHWSNAMVGYSLAFIGALSIIVQLWGVSFLTDRVGERKMLIGGLCCIMLGFFIFAFTDMQWLLFGGIIVFIIGGIQGTAMQSMISLSVPDNEQGALQGVLGCLLGFTTFVAPPMMTSSFSYFTREGTGFYFPGMPFLLSAGLTVIGLALCCFRIYKQQSKDVSELKA